MKALKTEVDAEVSGGQNTVEAYLFARGQINRPFHKISLVEEPLEPEPKPEPCEDPQQEQLDYECALDKLGILDKAYKDKNFGFLWKTFQAHARKLFELFLIQKD